MTDEEKIALLRGVLMSCDVLFGEIRNDWTDPRSECRAGRNLIATALGATQEEPVSVDAVDPADGRVTE